MTWQPIQTTLDNSEWIEWSGGERPIEPKSRVAVGMRNYGTIVGEAQHFVWKHSGGACDITKYIVVEPIRAWSNDRIAMPWQPIDTAPRDGTEIIGVFSYDYGFQDKPTIYGPWTVSFRNGKWMASWDGAPVIERETYAGVEYQEPPMDPTHWMPHFTPPESLV